MGQDYGFFGKVTLPGGKVTSWREKEIDPSKLKGWPEDWEPDDPDEIDAMSPEDILDECPELDVTWRADGLDLRGMASDDGDAWLTHRINLVALVRSVAKLGGEGELLIVDVGGEEGWKAVASADGKSRFTALKGAELEKAAARIAELDA